METFELNDTLNRIIQSLQSSSRLKKIELNIIPYKKEIYVQSDKLVFIKIIKNLVSNALKFTMEGGTVTLSTISLGDKVDIIVEDSGIGIPFAKLITIFEKHVSLNSSGTKGESNSDLSLYFVKSFLNAVKGKISVTTEEGVGSIFTVTLPLRQ